MNPWVFWIGGSVLALILGVIFMQLLVRRRKHQFVFTKGEDLPRLNRREDLGDVDPSGGVRKRNIPPTGSGSSEERIPFDSTTKDNLW